MARNAVRVLALASMGWLLAANAQFVPKAPAVGVPVTPPVSGVAVVPVTYSTRSDGTREMTVQLEAPNAEVSVQRAPDVALVRLRSTTWFCEVADSKAAAGDFVNAVRSALNAFLNGSGPAPQAMRTNSVPTAALDAFARLAIPSQSRVVAELAAQYPAPNQGPAELRRADCYTPGEMQAIKDEADRILRLRGG